MPEPLRTQRYEGLFQSQTQEQFQADARTAAEHDWYPKSEKWTGSTLFVEYEHDPGRRTRAAAAARPPAQPNARAVDPDRDQPTGRKRRMLLGVGVALALVSLVVVTMVGSQLMGRSPAGGARAGGDIATTPAGAAIPVTSPLGTRAGAVELFRERGYSGVVAQMVDGRDRWRASDKRSSVAEIIGPEDGVTEVSLAVRLLRDEKRNNKARSADLGFLFQSFAPIAGDWATDELELTDLTMARTAEQQFGDVLVRLVSMPVKGGAVVKFQIMTD
jgi:hypothetical protein